MRTENSKSIKDIWNLVITDIDDNIIKQGTYKTLKHIADDVGLSYNQVADLKNNRCKRMISKFKYQPIMKITRINPTQKEFYNNKRILKLEKSKETE